MPSVMAGRAAKAARVVPAIHVFAEHEDVDARHEAGHDEEETPCPKMS